MRYPIRIEGYIYVAVDAESAEQALERALELNQVLYANSPHLLDIVGTNAHLLFYPDPDEMALEVLDAD